MPCFCSLFAILGRFWGCLYAIFYRIKHKNRQNKMFCLFYRFIEDNFQSFIPWFVRDIR